ncbi:MAG: PHP domain-containing protein [Deltaproteobacteria bacterium]|nr:PHP domain-containing protein [Deltaproteobacteria bacterium]
MKKIDLHIHSKCSDGKMTVLEIFCRANQQGLKLISITDHDSIECQEEAKRVADQFHMQYLNGLELNISFSHPDYIAGKPISLDLLAYDYDDKYPPLVNKLIELRAFREKRAAEILEKVNMELEKEKLQKLTKRDLVEIQNSVDGSFGRPHIANYLVKMGIVAGRQEAFDKYLVKCNVPKMPVSLPEASELVKGAGGKLILAHPNDPRGTSLIKFTKDPMEQQKIICDTMLPFIDGVECFHSMHDPETTASYVQFAQEMNLMITGGSDCHQNPIIMGSLDIPEYVAEQFGLVL